MEGTFKGWMPSKTFGFIDPDDDSDDVFVHQAELTSPESVKAGARLAFDVEANEKGRRAVGVTVLSAAPAKRLSGRVKLWNERG